MFVGFINELLSSLHVRGLGGLAVSTPGGVVHDEYILLVGQETLVVGRGQVLHLILIIRPLLLRTGAAGAGGVTLSSFTSATQLLITMGHESP